MPLGREKIADDEHRVFGQRLKAINTNRRLKMEQVIMKNIMRLIVVSSTLAIAVNSLVMFG
jgi:hypothetical protein